MKLTPAFKEWLVANKSVAADASDDDFRKAASEALVDGTLSPEKYAELQKDPDSEKASGLESKLDRILAAMEKSDGDEGGTKTPGDDGATMPGADGSDPTEPAPRKRSMFERIFADGESGDKRVDEPVINVVTADKQYDKSSKSMHFPEYDRKGRKHALGGQRLFEGGSEGKRYIDDPSELDQAINGAFFKWLLECENRKGVPRQLKMTDHDRDLVQYALRNSNWAGVIHGQGSEDEGAIAVKNRKLSEFEIKAVLDDSTSGGLEIAPIVFDDQIITTPLLHGEFFPRVQVVNITRGRRIEGGSVSNVTLNSGGADGTDIDLENTANFVAAFDTNIHVVDGAIELGLDFLSDSPVDLAGLITTSYGERMLQWLDDQICVGDGTTEPEGITNASGTTAVNADNAASGPPTVGDYESLLFGVAKEFRGPTNQSRTAFGANETTYQRARGIAVGGSDARRVFGMTHEDYMLLGRPFGINGQIGNRTSFLCNFAGYRMYRRLGLTIRSTTEGKTLVRQNMLLISARARFGGALTLGGYAAIASDGQS